MITKFNPQKGINELVYTKVCQKCKKEKELEEFGKQKTGKWGRKGYCKLCCKEYNRDRYLKNSYAIINKTRQWANKNNEKTKKYKRDWVERQKDESD